eukprot:CAMPEP_0113690928 /NCGR_PEP_ID=MMETSP0038_2-20120614/18104_1 /TAXON_ID=2898 /ORGANISM="Cryptomonas paramecium" /LENGTH=37 /DNA_ID=CAMNT_0000612389 /DNA_START=140 /DNA_END=250 /DNA_ORIENTATION=- /assembly_acc=CAM_ASM_000170
MTFCRPTLSASAKAPLMDALSSSGAASRTSGGGWFMS